MKSWAKITLAVAIPATIIAMGIGWLNWETRPQPPNSKLPPLIRNLPPEGINAIADLAFKRQVRSHFRTGIDAFGMVNELRADGFNVENGKNPTASFSQHVFLCLREWTILWHEDGAGHIHDIDGQYQITCP